MKVCKNFIEKQGTTSATICQNCGCEKWEHYNTVADIANAAFNKELRKNGFLALDGFFIKTANGKK